MPPRDSGGSLEQIKFLVNQGCIKPLCNLLICPDPRIGLDGLENILKVGEADREMGRNGGANVYTQLIEEEDGLDKIENQQTHDNNEIYEKAVKILERYWPKEGRDQDVLGFNFDGAQVNAPPGGFKFI